MVVSKTFTTAETMLNARTLREWITTALGLVFLFAASVSHDCIHILLCGYRLIMTGDMLLSFTPLSVCLNLCRRYRLLTDKSFYACTFYKQFSLKYNLCYSFHVSGMVMNNTHLTCGNLTGLRLLQNTWLLSALILRYACAIAFWDIISSFFNYNRETHILEHF